MANKSSTSKTRNRFNNNNKKVKTKGNNNICIKTRESANRRKTKMISIRVESLIRLSFVVVVESEKERAAQDWFEHTNDELLILLILQRARSGKRVSSSSSSWNDDCKTAECPPDTRLPSFRVVVVFLLVVVVDVFFRKQNWNQFPS